MRINCLFRSFGFALQLSFKEYYTIRKTTANTRCNGTKLDIPKIKLEAARKSTYYQGAIVFNELPENTRKETNYRTFKKQLN